MTRVPSLKTLRAIPWLGKLRGDPETVVRECRKAMLEHEPERALRVMDALCETHGVESVCLDGRFGTGPVRFFYLNTGDTYTTTVVYYAPTKSWRVTSWGDVVEADERRGFKYE